MAYYDRNRLPSVYVYYWDTQKRQTMQVPREETDHLDGLSEADIQRWVEEWEQSSGRARQRSRRRTLLNIDSLHTLIDAYLEDHKANSDRDLRPDTLKDYRRDFDRYILPFFVTTKSCKDVKKWHLYTEQFPTWMTLEAKQGWATIKKAGDNLLRFGRFLVRQHIIPQPWLLPKRRNKQRRKSPLVRRMDPDEPLTLAGKLLRGKNTREALTLLLGYFGSLRPEELFALETGDFLYSDHARQQAKSWAGFQKHGLGSGLSVIIDKTIIKKEPEPRTKTDSSRTAVNIFSSDAAKMIAGILKSHAPGRLFPGTRSHNNRQYNKYVKPLIKLDVSDLRKASGNYLGKRRGVDPFTLQYHMRHDEMSTTLLYCRDPADRDVEQAGAPNYDDVG